MFVVLGVVLERQYGWARFLAFSVIAMVAVALGVTLTRPDLDWYAGLSGVDSAMAALLAAPWLRYRDLRRSIGGIILIGLFAKSIYEIVTGGTAFADLAPGVEPLPSAHLVGAVFGAAAALPLHLLTAERVTRCV